MKRLILLFFCLVTINVVKAQPGCPSPFEKAKSDDSKFQIGVGAGLTNLKGDRESSNALGIGYYLNLDYRITNGIFVGLRGQMGELKMTKTNADLRDLNSNYLGFGGGILIHPFEAINGDGNRRNENSIGKDVLEAFYVGADVLSVSNTIKTIYRGNPLRNEYYGPVDMYDTNGDPIFKNKVSALMLPSLNIGLAPALNKNRSGRGNSSKNIFRIVFNVQLNFANNDELDGYTPYDGNMNRIGEKNDKYQFYSLGVRYSF